MVLFIKVGVLGLLKAIDGDEDFGKKKTRGKALFQAYVDVISVCNVYDKHSHEETSLLNGESKNDLGISKEPSFLSRELEFVSYFVKVSTW